MKCKHCGQEIIEGSRFCLYCSMPIDYEEELEKKFEEQQIEQEKRKKNYKVKKKIIGMIVSIVPICIIATTFLFAFYDSSSNNFTTEKVTGVISNIKKSNRENEKNVDEVIRIPIEMGGKCSSKSYEITLEDVDIIDKSSENAILYNFVNGEEYVFVKVSLYNKLYEDSVYSSLFHFIARCDGKEVKQSKSATLGEGYKFKSIDGLNYKRQTKTGFISYSLPENWKILEIDVIIDNIENEPKLVVENPKNRPISNAEIELIKEKCNIEEFLYNNSLYSVSNETINEIIVEFMHLNCLSKTDIIPSEGLKEYIKNKVQK